MKVAKKNKPVVAAQNNIEDSAAEEQLNTMVLEDATGYIRSAINSLGGLARRTGDAKYKEAIANLSVVLFDLQG